MSDLPPGETKGANSPRKPIRHAPASVAPGRDHYNKLVVTQPTWIEIELVGEDDLPIPHQAYRVVLPDGTRLEGTLDAKGLARIEVKRKGECLVTFPYLDQEAWTKI